MDPRVLQALAEHDVPATFFCLGRNVRDHADILRPWVGRHELGNHTFDHPDLARLDFPDAVEQIRRCTAEMQDRLGVRPRYFRPPYGHLGGASLLAAASLGLTVVLWSAQFREAGFVEHPDGIVEDAVSLATPGAIYLGHDTGPATRLIAIDRLGSIVAGLRARGWAFRTLSELVSGPDPQPSP